ncbi:MAG: hypothetical protein JRH13_06190 [Deltaproteobacteria bacterium]|nr:hypothetical protein [Deltaproteobacteria bacterium]MBW2015998.1 hypothetical protein [Deltaproteobacteria bacterium]MBW2128936.1 hypothetical protein [Deltaproteobacteria bacterium]MBW2303438.1 hypothetical protein [Deltaproteobacteria bacterium]
MARTEECRNFLVEGKCDSWIIARFKNNEFITGRDRMGFSDADITEEICLNCPNFKMNIRPMRMNDQ